MSPGCDIKNAGSMSRGGDILHAYIKMKTDPSSPAVPIQYNYLVQAAIYSALPEETAARLHDRGHTADKVP
jgi:CRISPR-associated endoribonuclease Cas6